MGCFITHSPAGCSQSYCPVGRGSSTGAGVLAAGAAVAAAAAGAAVCQGEGAGPSPGVRASSPSRTCRRCIPP